LTAVAITTFVTALAQPTGAFAQTSMGTADPVAPAPAPVAPAPAPTSPSLGPRLDYVPQNIYPNRAPDPAPNQPSPSTDVAWGAIGFTADGSYSTTWKMPSQAEAEAKVAKKCSEFGRGGCQVASFSGQECAGLATFIGSYGRRRWSLSFTAGGDTYPEAQNAAMARCNSDERTRGRCQSRTTVCADGR
jgi:hypothetical protein